MKRGHVGHKGGLSPLTSVGRLLQRESSTATATEGRDCFTCWKVSSDSHSIFSHIDRFFYGCMGAPLSTENLGKQHLSEKIKRKPLKMGCPCSIKAVN